MDFGPFELQACGENDYTMKSLGLLAFRPDLRERLVCQLVGDDAIAVGEQVSILFFSRIGENFFREAIEREYVNGARDFELRCNLALGLPPGFRWRRNANGKLTQPAKWQLAHIEAMLAANGRTGDTALLQRLRSIQDDLNTEPDVVLQWGRRLAIVEVKVLSGQGVSQVDRQRRLADFLAAMTGLERPALFLLGPVGCKPPSDPACRLISWAEVAGWFDDVPQIADYIRHSAFFYGGSWRTMLGPVHTPPGATAWDLMLAAPHPREKAHEAVREDEKVAAPAGYGPAMPRDAESDPYSFHHLGDAYFAEIINGCRQHGIWPLRTVWVGVMGRRFADKAKGERIRPNWMVEDTDGNRHTRSSGFSATGSYKTGNMRAWPYREIAEYFGFDLD